MYIILHLVLCTSAVILWFQESKLLFRLQVTVFILSKSEPWVACVGEIGDDFSVQPKWFKLEEGRKDNNIWCVLLVEVNPRERLKSSSRYVFFFFLLFTINISKRTF